MSVLQAWGQAPARCSTPFHPFFFTGDSYRQKAAEPGWAGVLVLTRKKLEREAQRARFVFLYCQLSFVYLEEAKICSD